MKKIMSVGQCNPDHFSIKIFLEKNFNCQVVRIDSTREALEALQKEHFDLVLVNRKLDIDYTDGTILIQEMKANPAIKNIPVMLISNYPEYQQEAVKLGAILGFGKSQIGSLDAIEKVKLALGLN